LKIGVIGVGSWGKRVVGEYNTLVKEGKLTGIGICEKNPTLMKQIQDINPAIVSTDYKEFLNNKDLDAVHICVPNEFHYDIAKHALKNGKHVLLEKPITQEAHKAYELVEIASQEGLILQVGHIFRFANVIRKTKELIEQGYFGKIYYMTLNWTTLMNYMEGIDIIWDLLPHPLDMIHFLTGEYPKTWHITAKPCRRKSLNELAVLELDYNDFFATIELSWVTPERKRLLQLVGSQRQARIECVKQQLHIFEGNEKEFDIPVEKNNTIRDEALNFIESITNKKMPYNAHIIGAQNVDIIEKIVKSI
jgi:UDP-2-acetamido-3-amino-2,3-dideoxy-glucuronate N-acetyltransferase